MLRHEGDCAVHLAMGPSSFLVDWEGRRVLTCTAWNCYLRLHGRSRRCILVQRGTVNNIQSWHLLHDFISGTSSDNEDRAGVLRCTEHCCDIINYRLQL